MADLAPAGATQEARLAHRIGREVVVQHEALAVLALEHVHDLLVLAGAEGRGDQRLGLAAREERRAVAARQRADLALDGANIAGRPPVDARSAVEDLPAHDVLLKRLQRSVEDAGSAFLLTELRGGLRLGRRHFLHPFGLAGDGIGFAERSLGTGTDALDERRVHLLLWQFPGLLRAGLGKADDGFDHRLDLFVTEGHGAQHLILGELGRLRFDHEHAL